MQNNQFKKYISVITLVFIFSLPFFSAVYLFMHPGLWKKFSTTNYGQWAPKIDWPFNHSKARPWQISLWQEMPCKESCVNTLDKIARIRLAMGRKLYEVDIVLVVPEGAPISPVLKKQLKEWNLYFKYLPDNQIVSWKKGFQQFPIVLFGPEHQAVLMYPENFDSKKMYHDLQVLIK